MCRYYFRCVSGTTSACAENTVFPIIFTPHPWNYLRVRGEYKDQPKGLVPYRELPPRARRIPDPLHDLEAQRGTTSACAENTRCPPRSNGLPRNYLRVRGEYRRVICGSAWKMELPPRARRIPGPLQVAGIVGGTTSACAENTCYYRSRRY